jgi:hypothetical protein
MADERRKGYINMEDKVNDILVAVAKLDQKMSNMIENCIAKHHCIDEHIKDSLPIRDKVRFCYFWVNALLSLVGAVTIAFVINKAI